MDRNVHVEKRIGAVVIIVREPDRVEALNRILSTHASMILGRQGIPLRDREINVISLVLEGTTDELGALTGRLGRIPGVRVKSVLAT
jgi:putative iron-only hydrogenase system regulator